MGTEPRSLFGRRLRKAREMAGLAQDKLGVSIGIDETCSSARISRYETGTHEAPFHISERLAKVLGINVAYLYCPDERIANLLLVFESLSDTELKSIEAMVESVIANR